MKNKGAMFYTLIGLVVIIMISIFVIHVNNITYSPALADEAEQDRFNNAIYDLHSQVPEYVRRAAYPVIWKIGHDVDSNGVNKYLGKGRDEGLAELRADLIQGFTESLNEEMCNSSTNCTSTGYQFLENGVPLQVDKIEEEKVKIDLPSSGQGLSFNITLHMTSEYKNHYYEEEKTISADVPARLFEMYQKAQDFHQAYDTKTNPLLSPVVLFTYGMTWGRAYKNAYTTLPENTPLIKQGYFTYDPIDQINQGNLEAMKNFKPENLIDWGSIPIATTYSEWKYLGEPAILPPGVDLEIDNTETIRKYITENIDLGKINEEIMQSNSKAQVMTAGDFEKAANEYNEFADEIESVINEINNWDGSRNDGCGEFKAKTKEVLESTYKLLNNSEGYDNAFKIRTEGDNSAKETDDTFSESYDSSQIKKPETDNLNSYLKAIKEEDGSGLLKRTVDLPEDDSKSCSCRKCGHGDRCGDCDPDGLDYSWDRTCETKECCLDYDEEGECNETAEKCSKCECECVLEVGLVNEIDSTLKGVKDELEPQIEYMRELATKYANQASSMRNLDAQVNEVKALQREEDKYDVRSSIDYNYVQYTKCWPLMTNGFLGWGNNPGECYNTPTWRQLKNGTCGDTCTSGAIYGAQIAAATAAAIVVTAATEGAASEAAAELVKASAEWFPIVYDIRAEYKINEEIIDDKNRIMLHNIFAGDEDLYGYNLTSKLFTHVAPEFVIYQNHSIKSGDVFVVVYVHLKDSDGPKKVTSAMSICNGGTCNL